MMEIETFVSLSAGVDVYLYSLVLNVHSIVCGGALLVAHCFSFNASSTDEQRDFA